MADRQTLQDYLGDEVKMRLIEGGLHGGWIEVSVPHSVNTSAFVVAMKGAPLLGADELFSSSGTLGRKEFEIHPLLLSTVLPDDSAVQKIAAQSSLSVDKPSATVTASQGFPMPDSVRELLADPKKFGASIHPYPGNKPDQYQVNVRPQHARLFSPLDEFKSAGGSVTHNHYVATGRDLQTICPGISLPSRDESPALHAVAGQHRGTGVLPG